MMISDSTTLTNSTVYIQRIQYVIWAKYSYSITFLDIFWFEKVRIKCSITCILITFHSHGTYTSKSSLFVLNLTTHDNKNSILAYFWIKFRDADSRLPLSKALHKVWGHYASSLMRVCCITSTFVHNSLGLLCGGKFKLTNVKILL